MVAEEPRGKKERKGGGAVAAGWGWGKFCCMTRRADGMNVRSSS